MRVFGYIAVGVWGIVGVAIFVWNLLLSAQMTNNRVPKQHPILGRRQFALQTDPADFTALGQQYRRKSIRAELIALAYMPSLFMAVLLVGLL